MWLHRIDRMFGYIHLTVVEVSRLIAIGVGLGSFYFFMTKVVALWH